MLRVLNVFAHLRYLTLALQMILLSQEYLKKVSKGLADMHLDETEFLIALILKNLGEECDLVVVPEVDLDRVDDGRSPLYDQRLESIFLIQVGIHELLHSFDWQPALSALEVVLNFLILHIGYNVFELLQGQDLMSGCMDTGLCTRVQN